MRQNPSCRADRAKLGLSVTGPHVDQEPTDGAFGELDEPRRIELDIPVVVQKRIIEVYERSMGEPLEESVCSNFFISHSLCSGVLATSGFDDDACARRRISRSTNSSNSAPSSAASDAVSVPARSRAKTEMSAVIARSVPMLPRERPLSRSLALSSPWRPDRFRLTLVSSSSSSMSFGFQTFNPLRPSAQISANAGLKRVESGGEPKPTVCLSCYSLFFPSLARSCRRKGRFRASLAPGERAPPTAVGGERSAGCAANVGNTPVFVASSRLLWFY